MDEAEEVIEKITVSVTAREIARMDRLVAAPELRFTDRSHLCWAAILSFLRYKEMELDRIRSGGKWR